MEPEYQRLKSLFLLLKWTNNNKDKMQNRVQLNLFVSPTKHKICLIW